MDTFNVEVFRDEIADLIKNLVVAPPSPDNEDYVSFEQLNRIRDFYANHLTNGFLKAQELAQQIQNYKMYILVLEKVNNIYISTGMTINSIAHGVLMAEDRWKNDPDYKAWRRHSFKKVTCKVTEEQLEKLYKQVSPATYNASSWDLIQVTESSLDNATVVVIVKPNVGESARNCLRKLPLY